MPFGISTAPEEFECKLQEKVDDLPRVEVLRDDMLVIGYGKTQQEADRNHNENLKRGQSQDKQQEDEFPLKGS